MAPRLRSILGTVVIVLGAFAWACERAAEEAPAAADLDASPDTASPEQDAGSPVADDAGACTDLELEGPPVVYKYELLTDAGDGGTVPVPIPEGGTVVDGTYILESAILYRGYPPGVRREIMRVTGKKLEMVSELEDENGIYVQRGAHTFTTDDLRLIPFPECSAPPLMGVPGAGLYEATPDGIAIQFQNRARAIRWQYKRKR